MTTPTNEPQYPLSNDPLWFKDAVFYQVHVRTFFDSDGDGIGDFRGLTQKLDYLADLGVTVIWVLPFYPSPLRDDGYDIADYRTINPMYGNMADFKRFLHQAHLRGMRVVTELVINHTSDQHPWFQRARTSPPGSNFRNFYVWSDNPSKYSETRIIFKDFEPSNWTFDSVANSYYWHRFFHHQPDLNFDNSSVRREVFKAMDYWFSMGVDGMRLDAIPYLYEREGTNCENLPETHAFLKELRAHVDANFPNRMLLAEANQWPEDAVEYFGDGDECHMEFHFPVMPRLFMAIQMEDRFPIVDIMRQTPAIPESAQWAMFLRNHDELTLEMVTDEERDYMYRVYADDPQARINLGIRRRLAPLLGNDIRKIQLMNALLFSMPGTPIVYYGDEIGMGDNVYLGDRNGVRTPMQWSADRNAGFSKANPQKLYSPVVIDPGYHYEAVNVEAQQANPNLLLWWMKRIIAIRKQSPVWGRGSLEFLYPENAKVLAFVRSYQDQTVLVVANLSRYAQSAQLDLSRWAGASLKELFGQSEFPRVGEGLYNITIGAHDFYWLLLNPAPVPSSEFAAPTTETPKLLLRGVWTSVFANRQRSVLTPLLVSYVRQRRWFGGKSRVIQGASIDDIIPLTLGKLDVRLVLLKLEYRDGEPEVYSMMLAHATGDVAEWVQNNYPGAVVAKLAPHGEEEGLLYDAMVDPDLAEGLLQVIQTGRHYHENGGAVIGSRTRAFARLRGPARSKLSSSVMGVEQSNTSVVFENKLILKLFRRPGQGINPDLEIGRALTEQTHFTNTAQVAGAIEYVRGRSDPTTIAVLQGFVENQGDAWRYTLDNLASFFDRALASQVKPTVPAGHIIDSCIDDVPDNVRELVGGYLLGVVALGLRTADMHRSLGSIKEAAFRPEPFTAMNQRSLYAALRAQGTRTLQALAQARPGLTAETRALAEQAVALEPAMLRVFERVRHGTLGGMQIRTHGDYHLGQVLYTGSDFVIIDFEGEPARAISERRLKRSPLRDVAGMLRSFHYAAQTALHPASSVFTRPEDAAMLEQWADTWTHWVSASFLEAYREAMEGTELVPEEPEGVRTLLDSLVLEKALYEVMYELNNRPDWLRVPLTGVISLVSPDR